MGVLRTTLALSGWGSFGVAAGYVLWTRQTKIVEVPPNDYIFNHTLFARYNPNNAPVTQGLCVRRVPLDKLRPELIEQEGKLVEAFCAGVWSGPGYAYQRRLLERKYKGPDTADQLWDQKDLQSSSYPVGTIITNQFEVLTKTPTSIIVRAGDSPRKSEVRESDGLFEMMAEVKREEGVAEFGLKSVFFNGLAQPDRQVYPSGPPMSLVPWTHKQYDKILMETAVANCTR